MRNSNLPDSVWKRDYIRGVSPALASYTQTTITKDVWKRPHLSIRDRSLVTVAILIARIQTVGMLHYFNLALDSGVRPDELSETVTHLVFYSGWSNALSAVPILKEIFRKRGIAIEELPGVSPQLLPLNEEAEAQRAATVEQNFGAVAPGVVQYTTDLLFRNPWLRPALAPRDRSLVTVTALIASGQVPQITYHLNRAMDNGLTQRQASELLTHLAFYAGWPPAGLFCAARRERDLSKANGERVLTMQKRAHGRKMNCGRLRKPMTFISHLFGMAGRRTARRHGSGPSSSSINCMSVAYNGRSSRWYQAALRQKAGRITAAGITKEVAFASVEDASNDSVDEAYRAKYKGSPYLDPMIGSRARAATVRVETLGK
jgi:4-carboxymuconolactone decarboxylase